MKKTRIVSLLLLLIASLLLVCSCTSKEQVEEPANSEVVGKYIKDDGSKITIGFSVGTSIEERWVQEMELAQAWCDENGVDIIIQSADDDASKQVTQCENMITQGVDVLVISAKDGESMGVICDTAHAAGVKVLSYERGVNNGDVDYYICFDAVMVGKIQAKMLVDNYPEGNYIYLHGGQEDTLVPMYIEGNESILRPLIDEGKINVVLEQYCDGWSADVAMAHAENGLSLADNDIVAVLAPNDSTAGGVVQALDAQGLAGKVGVSGQDGDIAACQRIVEGTQTGTAFKYLPALNSKGMEIACMLAMDDEASIDELVTGTTDNGFKEVPTIYVPVLYVNKDNIDEIIIGSGFHTIEEVYANIEKENWPEIEVTGKLDFEKYTIEFE